MKKFKTYSTIMQESTDYVSIIVPPFSKLLDIQIESAGGIPSRLVALVEIDTLYEYDGEQKTFMFSIKKGIDMEFMPPIGYEYAKTIAIEKNELTSHSSGSGSASLNMSLASSNSIYRIFASEIKSTAELRDSKISELIEG
jgi:hypothetical protein